VPGQYGTFFGTDYPIDPKNRRLEYGISDLNQHHRFCEQRRVDAARGWDFEHACAVAGEWLEFFHDRDAGFRTTGDTVPERFSLGRDGEQFWRRYFGPGSLDCA
jgi:hypothetical protein